MAQNLRSYSLQEVSTLSGVRPYVLRFWLTEFGIVSPAKGSIDLADFSEFDLKRIERIKHLLFEEKMSIPEAKEFLSQERAENRLESLSAEIEASEDYTFVSPVQEEQSLTPITRSQDAVKERIVEVEKKIIVEKEVIVERPMVDKSLVKKIEDLQRDLEELQLLFQ